MRLLSFLATGGLLAGCASAGTRRTAADEAADRAALLRLHAEQRVAHLERRASLLGAGQADSLVSVDRGRVSTTSRAGVEASFQRYFDGATFRAWDDAAPPRIRISPDGRMAYVIVEKRVHVATGSAGGAPPTEERVRYAWLSIFEKRDGAWRMTAIASTERPDAP